MNKLTRWLPFVLFISIALFSFIYLTVESGEIYYPHTDNPEEIYREACVRCHGLNGEGTGLLYPEMDHRDMEKSHIEKMLKEGTWLMPDFKNINEDTLKNLVDFIYDGKYLKLK